MHDKSKLGSVFGNETLELGDEIRVGIATEVKLSGNARATHRFDDVFETATGPDRLAEPVELQHSAGAAGAAGAERRCLRRA